MPSRFDGIVRRVPHSLCDACATIEDGRGAPLFFSGSSIWVLKTFPKKRFRETCNCSRMKDPIGPSVQDKNQAKMSVLFPTIVG